VTHYSGRFGADRKPFVAHTIGVASVLASLGQPALMVAAGALHNIYGNGDFGDGLYNTANERRRRLVRQAVGDAVEDVLYRFHLNRVRLDASEGYRQRIERLAKTDMQVLLLDLADVVDKCVDSSVLYHGDGRWIAEPIGRHDGFLVDIARQVGQPALATMLQQLFAEVAADPGLPLAFRAPAERKYQELVVPQSCRRRIYPVLSNYVRLLVRPSRWVRAYRRYSQRFAGPT
jgi:hypothetical protein